MSFLQGLWMASRPGQRYYQVKDFLDRKSAVQDLANQMQGLPGEGQVGPRMPLDRNSALLKYSALTGDPTGLGLGAEAPSDVKSYQFFANLTPEQQKQFLTVKRAAQIMDQGGYNQVYNPLNPLEPLATFDKTLAPADEPENARAKAEASASGTAKGTSRAEAESQLANLEAGLPSLEDSIKRASDLAKEATYTLGGKSYDFLAKELVGKTTKGSKSKAGFDSIINNEVVPQLKQMLGTQFTEKDREFAVKTMADTDSTPEQKQIQLSTYMKQRMNNIASLKRRLGKESGANTSIFDGVDPKNHPNLPTGDGIKFLGFEEQ